MKRLYWMIAFAAALLLSAASGRAMEIAWQFPDIESNLVLKNTPLTVVFDQSLRVNTVHADSFYVTPLGETIRIAGTLQIQTTNQANDTVVFTAGQLWEWGVRYKLHVTSEVVSETGDPFSGEIPLEGIFVANIPNDFEIKPYNPDDPMDLFTDSSVLMGYNPVDPEAEVEPWEVPGLNVTGAWKYSLGSDEVLVAVLDNGLKRYDDPEFRRALFLNAGELPLPNVDGLECEDYDCNLDGRFDVDDYEFDDRVNTRDAVSVADLLQAFSNGIDEDENGLPDDISGWDFHRNSNEVLGVRDFPEGTHGDGETCLIVSEGDNGIGNVPGICPECRVMLVRASAGLLYDYAVVAASARYAVSMGADLLNFAGVNLTWSRKGHQAFVDAYDAGAPTVAASGDEMTFHHWMPAAGEDVINVKTVFPMVPVDLIGILPLELFGFTETYCTNYGTHVHYSVPAKTGCTSDSTGNTSGVLALLLSYARQQGIDLAADEAKQLLSWTSDDVADHCYSIVNLFNMQQVCQEGFDMHFGYGRPDLENAMSLLGDPDLGLLRAIPPVVRVAEPAWWQTIDPTRTPMLDVTGTINSRVVPYTWRVQAASGHEPLDEEFVTVEEGLGTGEIDGVISTVPVAALFPAEVFTGPPKHQYSFEVTLRVQAEYESPSRGLVRGESRKSISVHADNDPATGLVPGFPIDIGASGESSPLLYDLDGDPDGRLEIVFGTADGTVEALKHEDSDDSWKSMEGFPVDISGNDPWVPESVFASVAVGDLFGDGTPQIVAATLRGNIYAINPDGAASGDPLLPGFPVSADPPDNSSAFDFGNGNGFMASPVLVDLDSDGVLEIVAASMDQKVYAWKPGGAGGAPERLGGWPVLCRSQEGLVEERDICEGNEIPSLIIGTPAVGVLDPASPDPDIAGYPSVVVATGEPCDGALLPESRVYAVYHDGMNHPGGPFLPGWPAKPASPLGDSLPIPMAVGSCASPAVFSNEFGTYVSVGSAAWLPQIIEYTDGKTTVREIPAIAGVNFMSSGAFSSLAGDGVMQLVMPLLNVLKQEEELGFNLFDANLSAIDLFAPNEILIQGSLEDHPMLNHPIVADLDGDGLREILSGTGGYIVHAYSPTGFEPAGWPKYTQKWIMAAPAAGDIDADGLLETVVHTREGVLYAWEATGPVCVNGAPNSDWPRYHHDERNTGFYGTDAAPPARITDLEAELIGGDQVRLSFTAPGDDWRCGASSSYDIRFTDEEAADLTDPVQFFSVPPVPDPPTPGPSGTLESFVVDAPGVEHIAIQASDDAGNLSRISNDPFEPAGDDDDDSGADDDDDDDDEGCGCG